MSGQIPQRSHLNSDVSILHGQTIRCCRSSRFCPLQVHILDNSHAWSACRDQNQRYQRFKNSTLDQVVPVSVQQQLFYQLPKRNLADVDVLSDETDDSSRTAINNDTHHHVSLLHVSRMSSAISYGSVQRKSIQAGRRITMSVSAYGDNKSFTVPNARLLIHVSRCI